MTANPHAYIHVFSENKNTNLSSASCNYITKSQRERWRKKDMDLERDMGVFAERRDPTTLARAISPIYLAVEISHRFDGAHHNVYLGFGISRYERKSQENIPVVLDGAFVLT